MYLKQRYACTMKYSSHASGCQWHDGLETKDQGFVEKKEWYNVFLVI